LDAQMSDPSYNEQSKPDYGAMLTALQAGNTSAIASASFNHFEQIVLPRQPRTAHTFEKMQGCGADMVRMSGSGPTVVGYFTCADAAARCAALFRADGYDAFAAKLLPPLA
jgi:4-diphosphocytidyl-2C-methyl-D-erythritol kinase